MKYVFLLFVFLFNVRFGLSQIYILEYKSKIIDHTDYSKIPFAHRKQLKKNRNRYSVYELRYCDGKSSYLPKYSIIDGEKSDDPKWFLGKLDLYKNFSNNTYYRVGAILEGAIIKEKFDVFEWVIVPTSDTLIHGFKCVKATAGIYGEFVTVWFTKQISIMDGPLYYAGLPGLVLRAQTKNRITEISDIELVNKVSNCVVIPPQDSCISHKQYIKFPRSEIFKRMSQLHDKLQ